MPQVYAALQGLTQDDSKDVAALIESNAPVAARVLQVVNSAFFRVPRPVTNIEQAVSYLGLAAIRNLTMSVEVFSNWSDKTNTAIDLNKLQTHVHKVAMAASSLTAQTPIADEAMLAGLLHDVGYWLLAQESNGDLKRATDLAVSAKLTLEEAEMQVMGATHAEIGAYLLGLWRLPYPVIEAVAYHHQPQQVAQSNFDVLAAVAVSHALVPEDDTTAFGPGIAADRKVDESYLLSVNAPFNWKEASRRVAERLASEAGVALAV